MSKTGIVFWVTGLPGAGKTTISSFLQKHLQEKGRQVLLLDGDGLREVLGGMFGHTIEERRVLARSYGRLCLYLAKQGFDVVIATVSMFQDIRDENRKNIQNYCEIYVEVPEDVLQARNQKNIYQDHMQKTGKSPFADPAFQLPLSPDIRVTNTGDLQEVQKLLISKIDKFWTIQ